jgi:hypothetical protein
LPVATDILADADLDGVIRVGLIYVKLCHARAGHQQRRSGACQTKSIGSFHADTLLSVDTVLLRVIPVCSPDRIKLNFIVSEPD